MQVLSFSDIVGQCFDGAANMSGAKKGVAARVKEVVPNAIYVHCYAHLLNLALHDTLENNTTMKNALGVIQSLHNHNHLQFFQHSETRKCAEKL